MDGTARAKRQVYLDFCRAFRLMKCPSCMAANVAIAATIMMGTIDHNTMGTEMKSKKPVILFANV